MYNYINEKIKINEAKRLCQKRNFKTAEKLFKEYISLDSKGLHPRVELVNLYIIKEEYTKAEKLILDSPKSDLLSEALVIVYIKTGREEEAKKYIVKYMILI